MVADYRGEGLGTSDNHVTGGMRGTRGELVRQAAPERRTRPAAARIPIEIRTVI